MSSRHKTAVSVLAPAKLNLHLDITGTRADGYHELISLFQMISLYDELTVSCEPGKNYTQALGFGRIPGERNLAYKAAAAFKQETGITAGVRIHARKHIPVGAGLGGGSSDAAAVLRALNVMHDTPLSDEELTRMGLDLGSDVSFFLNCACAVVTGRGENITPVPPRLDLEYLVVVPGFRISTTKAYSWFDKQPAGNGHDSIRPDELISRYSATPPGSWPFFNSFLPVILHRYPAMDLLLGDLKAAGGEYIGLSGSGSAFFAARQLNASNPKRKHQLTGTYTKVIEALPLGAPGKIIPLHID
jgi:4-diphosphocytidyl-2-C-methyl-D-erythritol kinase